MQIVKFTSPENQEKGGVDLNGLKPVEQVKKEVVFEVEEKLDDKLNKFFEENFEGENKVEAIKKYKILRKYFDIDNLEFWIENINKPNIKKDKEYRDFTRINTLEKIVNDCSSHEGFENMTKFLVQPGISRKIELFYKRNCKSFDFKEYQGYVYNKKIDPRYFILNYKGSYNEYLDQILKKEEYLNNFSNGSDILFNKYPILEKLDFKNTYYIFDLLDEIGENVFLFQELDISYDYFKNMDIGGENEDTKFIDFLIDSDTKTLKILVENISKIKLKDLFNIYKSNEKTLNGSGYSFVELNESLSDSYLFLFEYSIKNNNFYFLEQNIDILIQNSLKNNQNAGIYKIEKLLNKTGGFLTKSLFKNYVLEEKANLDEIWGKYENAMKKVLSSEEIKVEELDDFLYEAIYMAYRPTGFSENDIKTMIENGEIEDLTNHLDKIKFNKELYKLDFSTNKLKLGSDFDSFIFDEIKHILLYSDDSKIKSVFSQINIKKFFSNATNFELLYDEFINLFSLNENSRIKNFYEKINKSYGERPGNPFDTDKKIYQLLNDAYELFGVVTKDSFYSYIKEQLEMEVELKGVNLVDGIFLKMKKIKDPKFKKDFEEVIKQKSTDINNISLEEKIDIITILTEKRIIEFGGFMRKKIKKELNKFKIIRGEQKQFKAIISKNIGSFFAKAGSELCTYNNTKMWEEERHIHLNLIDEEKNQIVGNIMLYFESERDYLIVRGFNPIKDIVNNYDNKTLVLEMIKVVKKIASENGFDKVYIPEVQWNWHNLSNRSKIQKLVWNESLKNSDKDEYLIENADFHQIDKDNWYTNDFSDNRIKNLYLL